MQACPILVAGAGIAGLTLGLALAAHGLRSRILERREALSEAGAGIQLGPNAMQVLSRLGVAARLEPLAGRPQSIVVRDGASGQRLSELPLGDAIARRFGAPYRVAHRADLQAALLAAASDEPLIELVLGFEVARWEEGAARVAVHAASGQVAEGAGLVGADGIWSTVRRGLFPAHPLTYAGKMAARTVLPMPPIGSPFALPATGVWVHRDAHVVHYPVRDHREVAVVVVVDEPDPREGWGREIAAGAVLSRIAAFAPQLVDFLRPAGDWGSWSLFDPPPLPAWSRGRIGLIGDAAHPILPFLAQGGVMAIEDADTLARLLAVVPAEPQRAFTRMEALRRARVIRTQDASRANGWIFHLHGPIGLARNLMLQAAPGRLIMARYDWLYGWTGDGL